MPDLLSGVLVLDLEDAGDVALERHRHDLARFEVLGDVVAVDVDLLRHVGHDAELDRVALRDRSLVTLPPSSSGGGSGVGVAVGVEVGVAVSSGSGSSGVGVGVVCEVVVGVSLSSLPPPIRITARTAMTAAIPRKVKRCARLIGASA